MDVSEELICSFQILKGKRLKNSWYGISSDNIQQLLFLYWFNLSINYQISKTAQYFNRLERVRADRVKFIERNLISS